MRDPLLMAAFFLLAGLAVIGLGWCADQRSMLGVWCSDGRDGHPEWPARQLTGGWVCVQSDAPQ